MKRGPGQPTKYRPEYCEKFIEVMESEGFIETFCSEIGIHVDTHYEWLRRHPEYSEAVKKGKAISKDLFLKRCHNAAWNADEHKVNNGIITLLAVNCHKMRTRNDTPEDKPAGEGPIDKLVNVLDKIRGE